MALPKASHYTPPTTGWSPGGRDMRLIAVCCATLMVACASTGNTTSSAQVRANQRCASQGMTAVRATQFNGEIVFQCVPGTTKGGVQPAK